MSVLTVAIILLPSSVFAQDTPGVTGAGAAALPANSALNGVTLSGLQSGVSVYIPGAATAEGQFQATLLGTSTLGLPQNIEVDGTASSGSNAVGIRTFSGTATMDMGDGTLPLTNVPITVTITSTSLSLTIGTTNLPAATLTGGVITIE